MNWYMKHGPHTSVVWETLYCAYWSLHRKLDAIHGFSLTWSRLSAIAFISFDLLSAACRKLIFSILQLLQEIEFHLFLSPTVNSCCCSLLLSVPLQRCHESLCTPVPLEQICCLQKHTISNPLSRYYVSPLTFVLETCRPNFWRTQILLQAWTYKKHNAAYICNHCNHYSCTFKCKGRVKWLLVTGTVKRQKNDLQIKDTSL